MRSLFSLVVVLTVVAPARAQEPGGRVVSLPEAVAAAKANHPQIRQARAATQAADARADVARAGLFPQLSGTASYQRTTANFTSRPGSVPSQTGTTQTPPSFNTFDYFSFGLSLSQLVWDFGRTTGAWGAAEAWAEAQGENEKATLLALALAARTVYFDARAAKALVQVARQTLDNQERHRAQIEAFVEVGTRPEIDLAQARTDCANARLLVINTENTYETSKARLNQAMGVEGPTDFEVADEVFAAVPGEEKAVEELLVEALGSRPEVAALASEIRAQQEVVTSVQGGYWPSLGVFMGLTDAGTQLDRLAWNWNVGASLSWPLFEGGATWFASSAEQATLENVRAQVDALRHQIRLEVDQAHSAVRAAKASLEAVGEALVNARQRLLLAEGRYETGVGSAIELGDAQLALTNAEAQKVQADYNLAAARAQLMMAVGRD